MNFIRILIEKKNQIFVILLANLLLSFKKIVSCEISLSDQDMKIFSHKKEMHQSNLLKKKEKEKEKNY